MMRELVCVGGVFNGKKMTVDTKCRDYAFPKHEALLIKYPYVAGEKLEPSLSIRFVTYIKFDIRGKNEIHTVLVPVDQDPDVTLNMMTKNYTPMEEVQFLKDQIKHLKADRDFLVGRMPW